MFGRWGFLPLAVPCAVFIAARLGALVFPVGRSSGRFLAGSMLTAAGMIAVVRALGAVHWLTGGAVFAILALASLLAAIPSRRVASAVPFRKPSLLVTRSTAPLLAAAGVAIVTAIVAAAWLPVWQWDALGYHLPYVNFALVARGFDGVPSDMPYVSTYPHVVETLIVALRSMLPDDRLVDAVQIPFALVGAIATAGIARQMNATRSAALAAGAAWIVAPAVFLQMPTDYVDVAAAAFFLTAIHFVLAAASEQDDAASMARRQLLIGAVALSLYVGTKPNSPLSAAVVLAMLVWAGLRARQLPAVLLALAIVLVGGATFVANALHYGNPVWPVEVKLGPFVLHGKSTMQHLLDSGAAAPHLRGPLPWRIFRSWTAVVSPPVFDMRIGGFGALVLVAMPAALLTLVRRRDPMLWAMVVAAVAAPDPSVARYVLAFPALILALAAPCAAELPPSVRPWVGAVAGMLGFAQVALAYPGLTGDGPPLSAYASMSDDERAQAVGADGSPRPFIQARARVGAGETFAFDQSMELPYLAWERDLRYRAVWIPDSLLSAPAVEDFLGREKVRVVAVADDSPTGQWLQRNPEQFLKLFQCKSSPCSVFARR